MVGDASAIACVLFDEPGAADMVGRFRDARLIAPALLSYELGNICLTKTRRHPEEREELLASLSAFPEMNIAEYPVDEAAVIELALAHRLSFYDASYLWLARELGAELVTLDKALARAAAPG